MINVRKRLGFTAVENIKRVHNEIRKSEKEKKKAFAKLARSTLTENHQQHNVVQENTFYLPGN